MTTREDLIVAVARSWIGTPYRHQQSCKSAGTDCLGLVRGIWRDIVGCEPERVPAYTADWSETFSREDLLSAARRWLYQLPDGKPQPGNVLLFRVYDGGVAKHLGIMAQSGDKPSFVHAYSGHGVVESPLSTPWARRIVARFSFP